MATRTANLDARIHAVNAALPKRTERAVVATELRAANGDWVVAAKNLKAKLPANSMATAELAHSLAAWSGDNARVVASLSRAAGVKSLRDVALTFDVDKLAAHIDPEAVPAGTAGATAVDRAKTYATSLYRKLYLTETSAVLQRMVQHDLVPIADSSVRTGVAKFLNNQPEFNIRTTSVYTAIRAGKAFEGVAPEQHAQVIHQLKTLQRVQALSPTPDAVPTLLKANLTSAFHVAEMPQSTFIEAHGKSLGPSVARQIYTSAVNARIRNEHAVASMRETLRGTGLAVLDGKDTRATRLSRLQTQADTQAVPIDLETLFGSQDYCACDECCSVYSPAAYFVELLQFLRNNDLDPKSPHTAGTTSIDDTPLQKLFRRRPDLGCLELTCANTNTVLPYVDLANEAMESFIVHQSDYDASTTTPKQATIDVFNVDDETSGELLATPQHTNYNAYCILKSAVYPFTLPFHQPIAAIRIFLEYLGTSRFELIDTFRSAPEKCTNPAITPAQQAELDELHETILDRAADAEFLGMTQEEYVILTKEAFWPKRYFEITQNKTITDGDYRTSIGVRPVHEYYGFTADADMRSTDETSQTGLTFVKKQFLPRTGIQYIDLVNVLKTEFVNPSYPQGQALTILDSIRASYRYLQTLVDTTSQDPKVRYQKLVAFLEQNESLVPLLHARLNPDPCHESDCHWPIPAGDLRDWVRCYFEKIGKLIVLELGEGPRLPIYGTLTYRPDTENSHRQVVGTLWSDGVILDVDGKTTLGQVNASGVVQWISPAPSFAGKWLEVDDPANQPLGAINSKGELVDSTFERRVAWLPPQDVCDLTKVRLTHLDNTAVAPDPLTDTEYDRMQRFLRLWRKMGWTIDETDKALVGLSGATSGGGGPGDDCHYVGFDLFADDCTQGGGSGDGDCHGGTGGDKPCPPDRLVPSDITPAFLHELVAVRKLLDLTGLPLTKLLTLWGDISTVGDPSLYARLFLSHNVLAIDAVFKADASGNYLTQPAKITDHIPVLMAALGLKSGDIPAIMAFPSVNLPDALTIANVSLLYRHALLAKVLHVKVPDLASVFALFGNPFQGAYATLDLLQRWGKMEDAGFTFAQLDYILKDHDNPTRPLGPSPRAVLQVTKTLYDGLNGIDQAHPDVTSVDQATQDLVRTKAGLLFGAPIVDQILGLLQGTTVYTTNAPANLTLTIPDTLAAKLKYANQAGATPPQASLQVTGILTDAERTQAKALSSTPGWTAAIDRVGKQPATFFNDVLFGIFPDAAEAQKNLLAGDVVVPADRLDPSLPDPNTAPAKRLYFLRSFLPFLRRRLAHRLVVDTMSGVSSLTGEVTDLLLSDILVAGTPPRSAMSVLIDIKQAPPEGNAGWKGYLIPSADDAYTFVAIGDTQPAPLSLDGQSVPFPHQEEDPSNVWSSDPVKLKAGKLLWLEVLGQPASQLQWKTATSPRAAIPSSALLPDYSEQGTRDVFVRLGKAALVINGFTLGVDEVGYWQSHASDFDAFDWSALTLDHWLRLQAYVRLRNALPSTGTTLLDLFKWAASPDDPGNLSAKIAAATGWDRSDIEKLLAPAHFDANRPDAFRDERTLVMLQGALAVAGKCAVDIDRLFDWAKPGSKFWACHQIAEDIRKTIRAGFNEDDWEQVVKPLNDRLRADQRQALVSHLLVQKDLIDWGVVDADSLFEFFLIDVQMEPCMQTSRIKQGISTVQLFIQRCLLGQEDAHGVPASALDRDRWEWMQKYRVWEANRKVFLYPENWIDPTLRDDKSPFYKELESALLQKDLDTQNVEDAIKSYLYELDGVANLQIVGLFVETGKDAQGNDVPVELHVFGRTRNAPYFFFYRHFDAKAKNWYAWERMQVDIPSYDREDVTTPKTVENGTYLSPVVWNKRLLVFFPQFAKKTIPVTGSVSVKEGTTSSAPQMYWEIKLAWSEYRNGKWTQKQVSSGVVAEAAGDALNLPDISSYELVPRVITDPNVDTNAPMVAIDVYRDRENTFVGRFGFAGSQIFADATVPLATAINPGMLTDFLFNGTYMSSWQAQDNDVPGYISGPEFDVQSTSVKLVDDVAGAGEVPFYHPFAHQLLGKVAAGGVDDLFRYYVSGYLDGSIDKGDAYGADDKSVYHELKRAYSLYNWELGFHAPMELACRLFKSQQFDQALEMCHHVFNPLEKTDPNGPSDPSGKPFWMFPPFKEVNADNVLARLFLSLQPGKSNDAINEWRDHPFQPHVVARSRPSAYMKWVVMQYIEILIGYGDYYFRQNTLETIPMAIQCYVMASHLYGPRGQKIPKQGKTLPETYNSLLDKWDAFGNAMVELEVLFPFSNQPSDTSSASVGLAGIFGSISSLYFCIPDNPDLTALRDTIDDRLFKIRHCEDLAGVFRQLPLFEPPINPALLVQAAAQGLSLSSVLNDLSSPMPNYRFYYLLQKALELCTELKSVGAAFLSAKEKQDAEALAKLRATQDTGIQNLLMEVKKKQLEEAQKSLDALQQSRLVPLNRMQYYLQLVGEDLSKVPDASTNFGELPNAIEQPVDDSGLKLIQYEKEEMDKAGDAAGWQVGIGIVETLASVFHALPTITIAGHPFGVGADVVWGLPNLAYATEAVGRGLKVYADNLTYQSTSAGRKGGFLRQLQDRVQQANSAGHEIKNIDKQVLTQQIRIDLANQEITNQQKQIDNAQQVEDFLRNKYTNQELYTWMADSLRTTYYQAYTLAYDLATRAEKAYRFERGLSESSFIQFGYWQPAYDGLLAGERLYLALKQLEAAYQEKRPHDFEVTKPISLRQLDPFALLELRDTGKCEVSLPEIVFDMDYPGHYMRRIKSMAMTIPCVIGPYTSLNCTLRLLEHKFRISALTNGKNDYPEKTDGSEDRFSTVNVPITSIAVSTGQNDSGVFELSFRDERYIPFEGAGAISKWRIELPAQFRQFDYDTISDVIMHVRYTAVDGGEKLKTAAAASVQSFIKSVEDLSQKQGLFAAFDLPHDFSADWYKAMQPPADAGVRVLSLATLFDRLPVYARGRKPEKVIATDVYLVTPDALSASAVTLVQGSDSYSFTGGPPVGSVKSFASHDVDAPMKDWQLEIHDTTTPITKLWLLVRYTLT